MVPVCGQVMSVPWHAPAVQVTSHAQALLQWMSPQLVAPSHEITHCELLSQVIVPQLDPEPPPQLTTH